MKYLKIQNNGELDPRIIALMGGTTKNDKYKIGKFGTGLKYTLAYLLRNNIDFKIFSGERPIIITTEKETINETEFEVICINNKSTSITTQMGKDWSAWMIIRELWCNALDEGGELRENIWHENITGEANKTTFYIQLTPEVNEVLENWNKYFIHSAEPIFENESYSIYGSFDGTLKLYKQGVLIYQQPDTKALFNYDIKAASINELREFKGIVSMEVQQALLNPNTETINYFFNNIQEDHYEAADMDYEWYGTFGKVWKEAMGARKIVSYDTVSYVEQNGISVEQLEHAIKLPKRVYTALTKAFAGVGVLKYVGKNTDFYECYEQNLDQKTKEVLDLLKSCDYEISPNLKIVYGIFSEKNKRMSLHDNGKELLISQACIPLELPEFARFIVEHNERFTQRHTDCSREMQTHLSGLYVNQLLKTSKITL